MYNRLYKDLTDLTAYTVSSLDLKRVNFQSMKFFRELNQSFEKNEFTLGVFVNLSKAFDTANHQILLKN